MNPQTTSTTAFASPLANATLAAHRERIDVPSYDRDSLQPAIVHFGVGGFHRAHQAVYLDDLAARGVRDCGVIGVSMRSPGMRDALVPQDWLYTVAERGESGASARAVGVTRDILFAPDEPGAVVAALTDPRTTIVSLTITGGAYASMPVPRTGPPADVFALIVEALAQRRRAGLAPFTVLSCDNVPGNGDVARESTLRWAAARDFGLSRWIESEVAFPSSVVDRIVPKTTPDSRSFVRDRFGVDDRWPVISEPYIQWIVEDDFSAGRPPLEEVGVQFVDDVSAYELMKKRLLNGGHCALGYIGLLAGYRRTDEAMADPLLRGYLLSLLDNEIAPLLDEVPEIDLGGYVRTLADRFANPGVGDQLSRLAERGSVKMPGYLLPSVEAGLMRGTPVELLSVAVAAWIRVLRGTGLDGRSIEIADPLAMRLRNLARVGGSNPRPVMGERSIFGDLAEHEGFVAAVERNLWLLERGGIASLLRPHVDPATPTAAR